MEKIIGFIPARGGSKRIPYKNMRLLGGKPLVAYTIEAARASDLFTDIVVSSDDHPILDLALKMGVRADRRPVRLCGDFVQSFEVVAEYLQRADVLSKFSHVAKLLPTCPFRQSVDLREAYKLYSRFEGDRFLVSITEFDFPPQLALENVAAGPEVRMCEPGNYAGNVTSQTFTKRYHPNGAIYMAPIGAFLREKTFFAKPLIGYLMPPERSIDIDYQHQLQIADLMMSAIGDSQVV